MRRNRTLALATALLGTAFAGALGAQDAAGLEGADRAVKLADVCLEVCREPDVSVLIRHEPMRS